MDKAGRKFDGGKARWSLLPIGPIREVIEILTFGAEKYEDDNWKRVPEGKTRYYDAAMRHITAWQDGEKRDPESGKSHLAHAICNIIFLLWFDQQEGSDETD